MTTGKLAAVVNWIWRQFRRLPLVLQWTFGAAWIGAIAVSVFVGDIGIAAMGTAIGLSGFMIGAAAGAAIAIGSWAAAIVVGAKRRQG